MNHPEQWRKMKIAPRFTCARFYATYFCSRNCTCMNLNIRWIHRTWYVLPIAFFVVDAGLFFFASSENIRRIAFYFFSAGILSGWILAATGILAFVGIRKNRLAAGLSLIHGFINSTALLVLTMLWAKDLTDFQNIKEPQIPVLFFKALMLLILMAGAWLGKTAVHKHL